MHDAAERPAGDTADVERLRAMAERLRAEVADLEARQAGEEPLAEVISRLWREGQRETRRG
jgi:hypothetical protein